MWGQMNTLYEKEGDKSQAAMYEAREKPSSGRGAGIMKKRSWRVLHLESNDLQAHLLKSQAANLIDECHELFEQCDFICANNHR